MKKLSIGLLTILLLAGLSIVQVKADAIKHPVVATEVVESAEVTLLLNRLEEIKEMDKKGMSSAEKKELRKEVRAIETELKNLGSGVYISVGAIIIILLLIIILL